MASYDVRNDRHYTKDHEWAMSTAGKMLVGLTPFQVQELGEITTVNIDVKPGDTITAGKVFGTIESSITLEDLFAPVSGKIERINTSLENHPQLVNEDCYGKGWMIEILPSDQAEWDALLDSAAYLDFLKTSAH